MAPLARLCLTGPECTGKTGFAERLARDLDGVWVPEFSRAYALRVGGELTVDDVEPIAKGQIAAEDEGARRANRLLILDTDLVSTVVYARHYYGGCPEWIEREARARRADLYLLLDVDVPWEPDGVRDAADPDVREDLFDAFRATLEELGCAFRIVSGDWEKRWEAVRAGARTALGMSVTA